MSVMEGLGGSHLLNASKHPISDSLATAVAVVTVSYHLIVGIQSSSERGNSSQRRHRLLVNPKVPQRPNIGSLNPGREHEERVRRRAQDGSEEAFL